MDLGQRNKISVTGNMSSMTDLVFLLLIFFVILSTLASNGVNVDLPQSKGITSQTSKLTVSIKPDLTYYVNSGLIEKSDLENILKVRMEDMSFQPELL
jgi:biopolymer transport protein ExbD